MNDKKAFILPFCGVDGTGKTSLYKYLEDSYASDDKVVFISRGPSTAESLVEQTFQRKYNNEKDWIETDFGNAIAIACAIDYVQHFKKEVVPLLNEKKIIILDRYSFCFKALALCLDNPEKIALNLLASIPSPDHIFYITSSWEVIADRIGESTYEFESLYCQKKFYSGYEYLLNNEQPQHTVFENENTLKEIQEKIQSTFEHLYDAYFND